MGLFGSISGRIVIQITSADVSGLISQLTAHNIPLLDLKRIDDLTVECSVSRVDHRKIKSLVSEENCNIRIIRRNGLYWAGKRLLRRPVLIIGLLLFLILALYLPTKILFIKVEGNSAIPDQLIMNYAQDCGIYFGASRRQVRNEKIKNALVERIPELQWVGVNTSGCVATIRVSEKTVVSSKDSPISPICSIVASRDGVIADYTVTKGTLQCKIGQAVKAGQTLVSGYSDLGIAIKATRAEAEVYAQTLRNFDVITPNASGQRGEQTTQTKKFSLIIGKNMLKLYNSSGLSGADCVKMYVEKYLTLPGGFRLPIALVTETWICYKSTEPESTTDTQPDWLREYADAYVKQQMIAGTILSYNHSYNGNVGASYLHCSYGCLEMISQVKYEEIIQ